MTMGTSIAACAKLGAMAAIMAAGIANAAEIKVIGSPHGRRTRCSCPTSRGRPDTR
jgi:hypothetical protein